MDNIHYWGGRFLSEAYCYALGDLTALARDFALIESVDMSSNNTELEEMNDTVAKFELENLMETKAQNKICDLHVVSEARSKSTTSANGSETTTFENTVTISRGMSRLTCSFKSDFSPEGDVSVESFDESQNFYDDLIHPAKPAACGPNEKLILLETKGMIDGGEYWTVKISYHFNVK